MYASIVNIRNTKARINESLLMISVATPGAKFASTERSLFEEKYLGLLYASICTWGHQIEGNICQRNANSGGGCIWMYLGRRGRGRGDVAWINGSSGRIHRSLAAYKLLWQGDEYLWLYKGVWPLWPGKMRI